MWPEAPFRGVTPTCGSSSQTRRLAFRVRLTSTRTKSAVITRMDLRTAMPAQLDGSELLDTLPPA